MITINLSSTADVRIISLWSKCEGIPGQEDNATYTVRVIRADSAIGTLEAAFRVTNQDDRPRRHNVCSTSAGDIMVLDGNHYLVEGMGFRPLTLVESEKIQKLTSRDTSFGYEFMVKHDILRLNNQVFNTGDAVVTKDGLHGKVHGYSKNGSVLIQTQPDSNTWQHMFPETYLTKV